MNHLIPGRFLSWPEWYMSFSNQNWTGFILKPPTKMAHIFSSFYFSGNGWSSGIRQCREHHHDQNWPLASQKPSKYFVRRCFWAPSQTFSKRCLVTTKNHRLHSLILVFGRPRKLRIPPNPPHGGVNTTPVIYPSPPARLMAPWIAVWNRPGQHYVELLRWPWQRGKAT